MTTRMFTGGGIVAGSQFQNNFRSMRKNALAESWPREHHDGGEVKTGNTPVMAPTAKWYGIEPWLAPEDEKAPPRRFQRVLSQYSERGRRQHLWEVCWKAKGAKSRAAQRLGREPAMELSAASRRAARTHLPVCVVVGKAPQLALPAYLHNRIGSATLAKLLQGPKRAPGRRI